jgi:clan AA aspartic protease
VGLSYARLKLVNARRPELAPVEVDALADTGAVHLCIPEHVAIQLQLDDVDERNVTMNDGSQHLVPYVGPLIVSFANRKCCLGALVLGNHALLGTIAIDDMDLVVLPGVQGVQVNPLNPNIAGSLAVGFRTTPLSRNLPIA